MQEAEDKLELLKRSGDFKEECSVLAALLLKKQGKVREALEMLEKAVDCSSLEYFLILGDLYWELGLWDKSLIPYLKVGDTKHVPKSCITTITGGQSRSKLLRMFLTFGSLLRKSGRLREIEKVL